MGAFYAGIVQRRLSNGIRVNYCRTDNEPRAAYVRLVAAGGRALEGEGPGPSGTGVVSVGTRTLSESGTVGDWRRDQVCSLSLYGTLLVDNDPEEGRQHPAGSIQAANSHLHHFAWVP